MRPRLKRAETKRTSVCRLARANATKAATQEDQSAWSTNHAEGEKHTEEALRFGRVCGLTSGQCPLWVVRAYGDARTVDGGEWERHCGAV